MAYREISAGDLRHRITVRRSADVPDGRGGFDTEWTTAHDRLPAEVQTLNGREAVLDRSLQGVSVYRIRVRYGADIRTTDQVLFDGRELNVRSADDPTGMRRTLVVLADTETPQGA